MTATIRTKPDLCSPPAKGKRGFGLSAVLDGNRCIVRVSGELDLAARDRLFLGCTARHGLSIVVDLSALTFMDCGGYGGIVASRGVIEADGRMLTMRGACGQPGRFFALIAHFERQPTLLVEPADADADATCDGDAQAPWMGQTA